MLISQKTIQINISSQYPHYLNILSMSKSEPVLCHKGNLTWHVIVSFNFNDSSIEIYLKE